MSILKKKLRMRPMEDPEPEPNILVKTEDFSGPRQSKPQGQPPPIQLNTLSSTKQVSEEIKPKPTNRPLMELKSSNSSAMKGTKIVRNYAKALCSFAYSDMATPYLKELIKRDFGGSVDLDGFKKYIKGKKGKTASISSLRGLLMEEAKDTEKESAYKKMFMEISIVFIKFFAVNWIFSGKVKYRLEHLKYRHKMLRRIKNPEYFTYLKSS